MIKNETTDGNSAEFRADPAEADLGNAQIGSDMPQGYSLQQIRIGMQQVPVSFGSGTELTGNESGFGADELLFGKFSAPVGHMNILLIHLVEVFRSQAVQLTVFQQLNILIPFFLLYITFHGNDRIALPAEPKGDLPLLLIRIRSYNPGFEKVDVFFYPVCPQQNLAFRISDPIGLFPQGCLSSSRKRVDPVGDLL